MLSPPAIPAPLCQPLDQRVRRDLAAARLQLVVLNRLVQKIIPRSGWLSCYPLPQRGRVDESWIPFTNPPDEGPRLPKVPEPGDLFVAPLRRGSPRPRRRRAPGPGISTRGP